MWHVMWVLCLACEVGVAREVDELHVNNKFSLTTTIIKITTPFWRPRGQSIE